MGPFHRVPIATDRIARLCPIADWSFKEACLYAGADWLSSSVSQRVARGQSNWVTAGHEIEREAEACKKKKKNDESVYRFCRLAAL